MTDQPSSIGGSRSLPPATHEIELHTKHDPHRQASTLSDIILG
jgi:hypothetical protein